MSTPIVSPWLQKLNLLLPISDQSFIQQAIVGGTRHQIATERDLILRKKSNYVTVLNFKIIALISK